MDGARSPLDQVAGVLDGVVVDGGELAAVLVDEVLLEESDDELESEAVLDAVDEAEPPRLSVL